MNGKQADPPRKDHRIIMENRRSLTITGVTDTDSFDEKSVLLYTCMGEIMVKGKGLKVSGLSVETGEMLIEGEIFSIVYGDKNVTSPLGLFGKLMK